MFGAIMSAAVINKIGIVKSMIYGSLLLTVWLIGCIITAWRAEVIKDETMWWIERFIT